MYSFCDQLISFSIMFSRFIHMVAYIRVFFFSEAKQYFIVHKSHILFTFFSINGHLRCFHLVAIVNDVAAVTQVYKYLFKTLLSILLVIQLEVDLLDHVIILFLICITIFHSSCPIFRNPYQTCYFVNLIVAILMGVDWYPIMALICSFLMILMFLMIGKVEHLFICFLLFVYFP